MSIAPSVEGGPQPRSSPVRRRPTPESAPARSDVAQVPSVSPRAQPLRLQSALVEETGTPQQLLERRVHQLEQEMTRLREEHQRREQDWERQRARQEKTIDRLLDMIDKQK